MAFGNYDGSVRIRADLSHKDFDQGIRSMMASVDRLGGTLKKMAGLVATAFGVAAVVNFGRESLKAASDLGNAWLGLQSIVEGQGRSFQKAKSFVEEYVSDGLVPLENAVTAYKNLAARGYDDEQIKNTMNALKDAAAFGRQSSYSLGEAVSSATEGLKNENSILVDNAGVTKNVAKMWDDYAKSIGTTANNLTQEQKIQAEVNGILEETKFQTGDAAKLVNTYSGGVAQLSYTFQQLKVAIGEGLMPIAQAVLPAINAITAALLRLAKVFAQVTALLFGKPKTGISGQAKTQKELASTGDEAANSSEKLSGALDKTGAAAKKAGKEMKGVTAPFDEFNILASQAASSAADAAGGIDNSLPELDVPELDLDTSLYEEAGEAIKSLGQIFSDSVDSMLAGIPQLETAFLQFSDSFNEMNQKLYDGFTFPGLKEKVQKLGAELAEAFNLLVSAIDWELWGRSLGAGLDLGLQFLVNFLYTFDWIGLGHSLAELVNGIVYEIDWYAFGQLLWTQFKIGLETFAGFLIGLDMPALAEAASRIVIGFFNSMQETIANIDWAGIGRQIAEFLNNVDWFGLFASVWDLLGTVIESGFEFLTGIISNGGPGLLAAVSLLAGLLGTKIMSDFVPQISKLVGTVQSIFQKFSDVFAIAKSAAYSFSDAIQMVFGPGSIIAGIGMIIGGATLAITNFISMLENGFSWANEALMLLGIAITAVGAIILGAPALVTGVIASIVAAVATLIASTEETREAFLGVIEKIKEAFGSLAEKFTEVVEQHIKPMIEQAISFFEKLFGALKSLWDSILSPFVAWITDVAGSLIVNTLESIGNGFLIMLSTISDVAKGILEALGGVIDFVVGVFTGDWEKAWNGLESIVRGVFDVMKSIAKGAIDFIKNLITGIFNDIADLARSITNLGSSSKSSFRNTGITKRDSRVVAAEIPEIYSTVDLPHLANGAVIPPNRQFAAILGDQRRGVNIEAPLETIKQAVTEAIQGLGGIGGDINITVESVLDGKVIARNTVNHVNRMTRSTGRSPILGAG